MGCRPPQAGPPASRLRRSFQAGRCSARHSRGGLRPPAPAARLDTWSPLRLWPGPPLVPGRRAPRPPFRSRAGRAGAGRLPLPGPWSAPVPPLVGGCRRLVCPPGLRGSNVRAGGQTAPLEGWRRVQARRPAPTWYGRALFKLARPDGRGLRPGSRTKARPAPCARAARGGPAGPRSALVGGPAPPGVMT